MADSNFDNWLKMPGNQRKYDAMAPAEQANLRKGYRDRAIETFTGNYALPGSQYTPTDAQKSILDKYSK
jgi:hypothetical protein